MRESIGGTWLFGIVITFIALFSSFLAYSISYTRAFNMKSEILNIIERDEGYYVSSSDVLSMTEEQLIAASNNNAEDRNTEAKIFYFIKKYGYNYTSAMNIPCSKVGHPDVVGSVETMKDGGYCLTRICPLLEEDKNVTNGTSSIIPGTDAKSYYKVTTFIAVTIPVINITLRVPITGETRTLFFDNSGYPCIRNFDEFDVVEE